MAVIHIGTITTLGAVPIASCTDGDIAYIWHESFNRKMVFDDDGTNATDEVYHPYYRRPDDYVDGGVWIEDVGDGQPEAWSGEQIKTGMITSTNWAALAGSGYDLDNANFKLGGSNVTAAGAAAGIFMGLDSGAYKFYAGDGSTKYIKFDGTDVEISGLISSSYLLSSSLLTAGTYLAESCLAAAATITGGDFSSDTEWPAGGGSGWIIDSANDRDAFTYTGKTATTLTGCSGVLAHTVSATNKPLVIPAAKGMYFADCTNELRFYGDRGDGTIEELANIGIKQEGSDYYMACFGSENSGNTRIGVRGTSYSNYGVSGRSNSGFGVSGVSYLGVGVYGYSSSNYGVSGKSNSGVGVSGISYLGVGVYGKSGSSHALYADGSLALKERSSDADPPEEGEAVFWMSDGTGAGDDGDVLLQVKAGGSTETYTLTDVHTQNTDTGTTQTSFQIDSSASIVKLSTTTTSSAISKTIGATGDYADFASAIAALPDMQSHNITLTIEAGTTLTETCTIQNRHASGNVSFTVQAEKYWPTSGEIPQATATGATSLTDDLGTNNLKTAAFANDYFNGCWIFIVDGTGTDNGFVPITDYDGSNGIVTVASWPGTQPDATSRYLIVGALVDGGSHSNYLMYVSNNTVAVRVLGIGFKDGDTYGIYSQTGSYFYMSYCGLYNIDGPGLAIQYSLFSELYYCGLVNCNTDNVAGHGGVFASATGKYTIAFCALSDNRQNGIVVTDGGYATAVNCFGDNNGTWGTYAINSGQANIAGTECSGSSGNHSNGVGDGSLAY